MGLNIIPNKQTWTIWHYLDLSKPHTSGRNGTSVTFTKIYVETRINGMSVMRSQKFTFKNWLITNKCSQMCIHHADNYQSSLLTLNKACTRVYHMKNYQSSLLMLHTRLVHMFITRSVTTIVY